MASIEQNKYGLRIKATIAYKKEQFNITEISLSIVCPEGEDERFVDGEYGLKKSGVSLMTSALADLFRDMIANYRRINGGSYEKYKASIMNLVEMIFRTQTETPRQYAISPHPTQLENPAIAKVLKGAFTFKLKVEAQFLGQADKNGGLETQEDFINYSFDQLPHPDLFTTGGDINDGAIELITLLVGMCVHNHMIRNEHVIPIFGHTFMLYGALDKLHREFDIKPNPPQTQWMA